MKPRQQSSEHDANRPLVTSDNISHGQGKTRLVAVSSLLVFVSCIILSFTGHVVDYPIMHFLNRFPRKYPVLDCSLQFLASDYLISGIFLLSLICYVWFCSAEIRYRQRILIGTMGAAFSGIFSRVLQLTLPTHLRPLHDRGVISFRRKDSTRTRLITGIRSRAIMPPRFSAWRQ
jgi:hypothetical protein